MTQSKPKSAKTPTTLSDFKDLIQIGHGAFGQVYRAIYKNDKPYALKKMSIKKITDQNMMTQLNNQIRISKSLDHPNIIKLFDTFKHEEYIYLVLELAQHGQLYTKLMKEGRFTQNTVKIMIKDMIDALEYLHSKNPPIIHRDIKPQNILLDKHDKIKLADFGWSNFLNKPRKTYCGTIDYLAPEMIDKSGHDQKLDIWCLGVLVYELLTGKTPFVVKDNTKPENVKKTLEDNIINVRIHFPEDFPTLAKDFVLSMIKRNPKQRLTLKQIKCHTWLKMESSHINQSLSLKNIKPADSIVIGQNNIIKELTFKIKTLQAQLHEYQISPPGRQMPGNNAQYLALMQQVRKLKSAEALNQNYKVQIQKLWNDLNEKDKQIFILKNQTKRCEQLESTIQKLQKQKKGFQQKVKQLQKQLQNEKKKQVQLEKQLNSMNNNIQNRIKNGKKIPLEEVNSNQFIIYLEEQLEIITQKFEKSQKILTKVLEREKMNEQKQNQLVQLRIQQKNIRQQIKAELKEQYQNKMDTLLLQARDQLVSEKQKWLRDYQQLKQIYDENSQITKDTDEAKTQNRQEDLQTQLRSVKQLNSYYDKTIKKQQIQIKDLQEQIKWKK